MVLPLVPRGTELDIWQGQALVSLVGFLFTDTRVRRPRDSRAPALRGGQSQVLRAPSRRFGARSSRGRLRPRARPALRDRRNRAFPLQRAVSSIPMRHHGGLDADRGGDIEYALALRHRGLLAERNGRGPGSGPEPADRKLSSSPNTTGDTRASAMAARSSTKSSIRGGASGQRPARRSAVLRRCSTGRCLARHSLARRGRRSSQPDRKWPSTQVSGSRSRRRLPFGSRPMLVEKRVGLGGAMDGQAVAGVGDFDVSRPGNCRCQRPSG